MQYKGWMQQRRAKASLDTLVTCWGPAGQTGALPPDEEAVAALREALAAHPVVAPVDPDVAPEPAPAADPPAE